jgi:hypothetical protein
LLDVSLRHPLLLLVLVKDRRAVLRADIVALPVLRGRVVGREEDLKDLPEVIFRGSYVILIASAWPVRLELTFS